MEQGRTPVDDWCDRADWVDDNRSMYRCSKCNKRLFPKEQIGHMGHFEGFKLPSHKTKGLKINRAKARKLNR